MGRRQTVHGKIKKNMYVPKRFAGQLKLLTLEVKNYSWSPKDCCLYSVPGKLKLLHEKTILLYAKIKAQTILRIRAV